MSLRSRLLLAFAFVIILSLAVSAVGTLVLLRNQEREAAESRVGRLAEPITLAVALLEEAGVDPADIQNTINGFATSFDVRILLVDGRGLVVTDTEAGLAGHTVDAFLALGPRVTERDGVRFRSATYEGGGEKLLIFAPANETLRVSGTGLLQLQTAIYELTAADVSQETIDQITRSVVNAGEGSRTLPLPSLRPLVAVPEGQVASAWRDLIPQLAIAGGIALAASAVAALLISRSVSSRLASVTQAAQKMAQGDYDQQLDPRGEDEVGRLARAFNEMALQVSRSQQMMRDLLANVSHELKTPLTSIQGFSQAMEEGAISSPEEREQAGRIINQEAQRMRTLIEDLIELSRLESGQAVVQREQVDLAPLLEACAGRFNWQLHDSGAALRLDLAPIPSVAGDERRLEQAFTNLIDNAVRHTPAGGVITISAQSEGNDIRITVHNTGSYIPPEELPRVFERFFQLDRNRSTDGAGLGLAIVSEVVQAHGGRTHATSSLEDGTEFVVTLPAASDMDDTSDANNTKRRKSRTASARPDDSAT